MLDSVLISGMVAIARQEHLQGRAGCNLPLGCPLLISLIYPSLFLLLPLILILVLVLVLVIVLHFLKALTTTLMKLKLSAIWVEYVVIGKEGVVRGWSNAIPT